MSVRVRFAPSPTGYLHVGGARTALYNWLFARSQGGVFILRSDDTDRERSSLEFAADILDGLRWLGLSWDEGLEINGGHPSYRQSERLARYQDVAVALVAAGHAYHSFATSEQLDQLRREAREQGATPAYDGRHEPDPDEARRRLDAGDQATIRFSVPRPGETLFEDVVRGEVQFDHAQVDDFVILRSDGTPTYHLASTVDDVDFSITHVIRGEDLLSSTPKHILLTEAMGQQRATYAHLSLLVGPDGSKLSKRHGDTSVRFYREAGYLPEAMVNYLALLGWSPGDDETIVPEQELVARFDLGAVSKNPATFDVDKLQWMSGVYMRQLTVEDFCARAMPLIEADLDRLLIPDEVDALLKLAPHVQERVKLLSEVPPQVRFLFVQEPHYEDDAWAKVMSSDDARIALSGALGRLEPLEAWDTPNIESALRSMLDEHELSARKGLQPIRVAVSGSSVSPPLFESLEALGRERSLARMTDCLTRIES